MVRRSLVLILIAALACGGQAAAASALSGQPALPGAAAFQQNCASCHGSNGKGSQRAPSLEAAGDAGFVSQTVRSGRDGMPSFSGRLSDAQISAVSEYVASSIATVSLTGGDLSRGGVLYRLDCAGCHGATARGGALVHTGGNAPALTGLAPVAIASAIRGGPGPMPVFPVGVISSHDLSSIVAYVRLLQQPEHPGGVSLGYRGTVTEGMASIGVLGVLVLLVLWIERRGRG
ncbi:MAG: c-type cytochrome [Thermoleophilia bacterium]